MLRSVVYSYHIWLHRPRKLNMSDSIPPLTSSSMHASSQIRVRILFGSPSSSSGISNSSSGTSSTALSTSSGRASSPLVSRSGEISCSNSSLEVVMDGIQGVSALSFEFGGGKVICHRPSKSADAKFSHTSEQSEGSPSLAPSLMSSQTTHDPIEFPTRNAETDGTLPSRRSTVRRRYARNPPLSRPLLRRIPTFSSSRQVLPDSERFPKIFAFPHFQEDDSSSLASDDSFLTELQPSMDSNAEVTTTALSSPVATDWAHKKTYGRNNGSSSAFSTSKSNNDVPRLHAIPTTDWLKNSSTSEHIPTSSSCSDCSSYSSSISRQSMSSSYSSQIDSNASVDSSPQDGCHGSFFAISDLQTDPVGTNSLNSSLPIHNDSGHILPPPSGSSSAASLMQEPSLLSASNCSNYVHNTPKDQELRAPTCIQGPAPTPDKVSTLTLPVVCYLSHADRVWRRPYKFSFPVQESMNGAKCRLDTVSSFLMGDGQVELVLDPLTQEGMRKNPNHVFLVPARYVPNAVASSEVECMDPSSETLMPLSTSPDESDSKIPSYDTLPTKRPVLASADQNTTTSSCGPLTPPFDSLQCNRVGPPGSAGYRFGFVPNAASSVAERR